MHKSLAEKIWSDPRAILSNGPPISPNSIPVEGGYNLSGRWNFSSGSRHATWALAIAPISGRIGSNGSDSKEMRDMFIPNNEVDWVDTWDVNGLRGTGSFSFIADEVFVDHSKTFIELENKYNIDFRALGFPEELIDNEPEEKGHEI